MTVRAQIGAGVLFGTLAAGPVYVTALMLSMAHFSPGYMADDTKLAMWAVLMLPALPIGAGIAFVPVLLGASLMGWLGRWNEAARLPVLWALAGGFLAGIPAWLIEGGPVAVTSLAATGAICALAARWQTQWEERELAARFSDA
jgi:hypothetical protein